MRVCVQSEETSNKERNMDMMRARSTWRMKKERRVHEQNQDKEKHQSTAKVMPRQRRALNRGYGEANQTPGEPP